jgi:uncharacterized protein YbaR (Trm112 family)
MSFTEPAAETAAGTKPIDPELLEILRCPLTRSRLRQEGDWLVAEVGGLRYPVREGFPVMLMEEATLPEGVASLEALKQQFAPGGNASA